MLFSQGEPSLDMYVVVSGEVTLSKLLDLKHPPENTDPASDATRTEIGTPSAANSGRGSTRAIKKPSTLMTGEDMQRAI